MRKRMLAIAVGVALGLVPLSSAAAGPPRNQACLGVDASSAARAAGGLGGFVSGTATSAPRAIGNEVQQHLAGEIPDTVFPNTCNDD